MLLHLNLNILIHINKKLFLRGYFLFKKKNSLIDIQRQQYPGQTYLRDKLALLSQKHTKQ